MRNENNNNCKTKSDCHNDIPMINKLGGYVNETVNCLQTDITDLQVSVYRLQTDNKCIIEKLARICTTLDNKYSCNSKSSCNKTKHYNPYKSVYNTVHKPCKWSSCDTKWSKQCNLNNYYEEQLSDPTFVPQCVQVSPCNWKCNTSGYETNKDKFYNITSTSDSYCNYNKHKNKCKGMYNNNCNNIYSNSKLNYSDNDSINCVQNNLNSNPTSYVFSKKNECCFNKKCNVSLHCKMQTDYGTELEQLVQPHVCDKCNKTTF
jgi:hypothetical protein